MKKNQVKELIKRILRETLIGLRIDLTKNLKYDRLTRIIFKKYLKNNYNCVDIGCHKGEILDLMLRYSPNGQHYGFEPIPYLFEELERKYKNSAKILPFALSDSNGKTTFQYVKNAPTYSGILKRRYDFPNPEIEEIQVELQSIDEIIPLNQKIDLIKIDVEGGEFGVLKGGKNLLIQNKPIIIFECGRGASDYYGTNPADIFNFITREIGFKIFTLQSFIKSKQPLNEAVFVNYFNTNEEYYFIASV